jgi:hypothetical protein
MGLLQSIKKMYYGCKRFNHTGLVRTARNRTIVRNCLQKLLRTVLEIFERHNIRYTMIYGTLLGAVRDGDFIKYDDDIDLAIHKDDWQRCYSILNSGADDIHVIVRLDKWLEVSIPECMDIPDTTSHILLDVVCGSLSYSHYGVIEAWNPTQYFFNEPLVTYTIGNIQCKGPNREIATQFLTKEYGNWRIPECGGIYTIYTGIILSILFVVVGYFGLRWRNVTGVPTVTIFFIIGFLWYGIGMITNRWIVTN